MSVVARCDASDVRVYVSECNPQALFIDGCDDALIGAASQHGSPVLASYSYSKLVEVFSREMSEEDAGEWVDTNVVCAYMGPMTPIIVFDSIGEVT